eukprot:2035276-Rhodomonas_salina.1
MAKSRAGDAKSRAREDGRPTQTKRTERRKSGSSRATSSGNVTLIPHPSVIRAARGTLSGTSATCTWASRSGHGPVTVTRDTRSWARRRGGGGLRRADLILTERVGERGLACAQDCLRGCHHLHHRPLTRSRLFLH